MRVSIQLLAAIKINQLTDKRGRSTPRAPIVFRFNYEKMPIPRLD